MTHPCRHCLHSRRSINGMYCALLHTYVEYRALLCRTRPGTGNKENITQQLEKFQTYGKDNDPNGV